MHSGMSKRRVSLSYILWMIQVVISSGFCLSFLPTLVYAKAEAVLFNIKPAIIKQAAPRYHSRYGVGYFNSHLQLKKKDLLHENQAYVPNDAIFQIEASDAIDDLKYSQPDITYSLLNLNSDIKVPSSTFKQKLMQTSAQNPSPANFQEQSFSTFHSSQKNSAKPMRDIRYLDSAVDEETKSNAANGDSGHKLKNNIENAFQTHSYDGDATSVYTQVKHNFTDASDNLVSASSDAVLSYEVPSADLNNSSSKNSSVKQSTDNISDVPSLNYSDYNLSTLIPVSKSMLPRYTTQNSVPLNTVYIDFVNQTNMTESIVSSSIFPSTYNVENVTNSLPSTDSEKKLSSGTVAGIVIAVLVSVTLLSSAVIYLLYRKFNGKCTSVVESKFNTDNCGYLDDSLRSSIYLNNHIELPKESSEEMTSLDNDSFLNSLETMTIQNYWADNSKNTKV